MLTREDELLRRIERLERRNRDLIMGSVAVVLVVCLAAAGSKDAEYDMVRARRFELVDSQGNQRGVLGFIDTTPVLRLGGAPAPQVSIEAQDGQTRLTLTSPGKSRSSVVLVAADPRSIVQADVLRGHVEPQPPK